MAVELWVGVRWSLVSKNNKWKYIIAMESRKVFKCVLVFRDGSGIRECLEIIVQTGLA